MVEENLGTPPLIGYTIRVARSLPRATQVPIVRTMKRLDPANRGHGSGRWAPRRYPQVPPLTPTARFLLLILGWLLILVGLAGLVLPGLQGVVTLFLGAAALSLVSRTMLEGLRYLFRRWPRAWRFILRARRRVHHWISRTRV